MTDGVTITASLWRDFMPGATDALIVAVTATAAGDGVLPPGLRPDRVDIRYADDVWSARLVEENPRSRTDRTFQAMARGGPRWPPGATVDVVVRLVGPDGALAPLRVPDQRIMGVS
jgi:hypothetical protein